MAWRSRRSREDMTYSFDDAKAKDQRKMMVFERAGNRAIYENGWIASSVVLVPWDIATCDPARPG